MISKSRSSNKSGCLYSPIIYGIAALILVAGMSLPLLIYILRDSIEQRGLWIVDVATYVALIVAVLVPVAAALGFIAWTAHSRATSDAAQAMHRTGQPVQTPPVFQLPGPSPITIEHPEEPKALPFEETSWVVEQPAGSIQRQ